MVHRLEVSRLQCRGEEGRGGGRGRGRGGEEGEGRGGKRKGYAILY